MKNRAWPLTAVGVANMAMQTGGGASLPHNQEQWISFGLNALLTIIGMLIKR